MTTRKLAACAVTSAILIAVQYALSFVSGVELVTVILLCFCYTFGLVCGMITATAFSVLHCLFFGFIPNVFILYLIYYNLFAVIFGLMGKHRFFGWVYPILPCLLCVISAYFATSGVPVSIFYQTKIKIMLWILYGISAALILVYFFLTFKKSKNGIELAQVTAVASFCTVVFTLLDDLITPLLLGYSSDAAIAYFYSSFLTMLPQTICVAVSVFLLFYPLRKIFRKIALR